jgi:hypothetical protein
MDLTDQKVPVRYKRVLKRKVREKTYKSIGDLMTSQLLPFRRSMVSHLERFGINAKRMRFSNVIPLYYNEFVSSKHNKSSPFVTINSYEFRNNAVFKISPHDHLIGDLSDFRNADGLGHVGSVVNNIVNTYKFAMNKRRLALQRGINPKEVLSDVEYKQALDAERVLRKLKEKDRDNHSVKQGTVKNVIVIGLIIFLLYYLFK